MRINPHSQGLGGQNISTEVICQVTGAVVCLIEQAVVDAFIIGGEGQVCCLFHLLCAVHWPTNVKILRILE